MATSPREDRAASGVLVALAVLVAPAAVVDMVVAEAVGAEEMAMEVPEAQGVTVESADGANGGNGNDGGDGGSGAGGAIYLGAGTLTFLDGTLADNFAQAGAPGGAGRTGGVVVFKIQSYFGTSTSTRPNYGSGGHRRPWWIRGQRCREGG